MDGQIWEQVNWLRAWLDENTSPVVAENIRLWRVLKFGEEFGEAAEAIHGAMGANPRKGVPFVG